MNRAGILCVFLALSLAGCGFNRAFYKASFKPEVLAEKKILASRKATIQKGDKPVMTLVATHLNAVDSRDYRHNEYFFLEIFSDEAFDESYFVPRVSSGERFLWIREVEKGEDGVVLAVSNKWARGFLVAFEPVDEHARRNMRLIIEVETLGSAVFDYSFEVFELKIL